MNKITEIKIERLATREVKDETGKRVRIQVKVNVPRPVNVVSGGKRFAHYFIDGIIFSFLFYPIDKLMGYLEIGYASTVGYAILISWFPIYIGYAIYYFMFEHFLQTTPGKMLTNTLIINQYGQKPELNELIVRSLVRLVPFEPLSCLSDRGWHDRWSGTWVVSKDENLILQELLNGENNKASN